MSLRFGYWLPMFGGWLRNVAEKGMEASWRYVRELAVRSEEIGFDVTLLAELNLNDINWRTTPSPIADCAPGWSVRPTRSPTVSPRSSRPASI